MAKKKIDLRVRALAREIALDLFTYGVSERAERLVQFGGNPPRQLGGWGIKPATDRIYKLLMEWRPARETGGPR